MKWNLCSIQCVNGLWGLYWPDETLAYSQKFKSKNWATRVLNRLTRV